MKIGILVECYQEWNRRHLNLGNNVYSLALACNIPSLCILTRDPRGLHTSTSSKYASTWRNLSSEKGCSAPCCPSHISLRKPSAEQCGKSTYVIIVVFAKPLKTNTLYLVRKGLILQKYIKRLQNRNVNKFVFLANKITTCLCNPTVSEGNFYRFLKNIAVIELYSI